MPIANQKFSNVDMEQEITFYDELNIVQTVTAFKKCTRSYSIEIIKDIDGNMNDPIAQLKAGRPVIKDLFRDLLIEMKGFNYQITRKGLLSKQKQIVDTEFSTVCFNSTAKIVTNLNKYDLNKSFQQILYK